MRSGNLNPIHERVINKPDVHQRKGMLNVSMCREGGKGSCHKQQQSVETCDHGNNALQARRAAITPSHDANFDAERHQEDCFIDTQA